MVRRYDETSLVVSDGKVTQWTDLSGAGNHLVQSNSSKQPAYDATGYSGILGSAASNGSFGAAGKLSVGARPPDAVSDNYYKGRIARLLVLNTAPDAPLRQKLDDWLARPADATEDVLVAEGDSLTYTGIEFGGYDYETLPNLSRATFLRNMATPGIGFNIVSIDISNALRLALTPSFQTTRRAKGIF